MWTFDKSEIDMSTDYTCFSCTQVTEHSTTTIIRLLIIVFSFPCLLIRLKGQGESMSCYNRFFQYFVCNRLIAVHFSFQDCNFSLNICSAVSFLYITHLVAMDYDHALSVCIQKKYIKCYHIFVCVYDASP